MIAPHELHELLTYDPDTGELRNRVTRGQNKYAKAGELSGSIDALGYRRVKIYDKYYKGHRIAWAMTHGRWPEHEIDHVNGKRDDNRLANLREASRAENARNRKRQRNNTSGWRGVARRGGRWQAYISVNGDRLALGTFKYKLEAAVAYAEAAAKYHGEFART